METQILNPLEDDRWEGLISAHPSASFFHGTAWARVLHQTYGHRPMYLRFARGQETVALLPMMEVHSALTGRRGVCLPFTDVCGPLVFDEAAAGGLMPALCSLARERKWRHFEVRAPGATPAEAEPATTFYGHWLDLREGAARLFAGFSDTTQRAIRKAERNELRAEVAHHAGAMDAFYQLHVRTRRHHGLPPQPISFFRNIWQEVIQPGFGFIALVAHRARTVAACVFFCREGRAVYKFGASEKNAQPLRSNNLVMWSAIQCLVEQAARSLHFGRTSLHHEGLRRFKLGWGAREESLEYFRFDLLRAAWAKVRDKTSGLHNVVFGHLPLPFNRLAGALIYPHLD